MDRSGLRSPRPLAITAHVSWRHVGATAKPASGSKPRSNCCSLAPAPLVTTVQLRRSLSSSATYHLQGQCCSRQAQHKAQAQAPPSASGSQNRAAEAKLGLEAKCMVGCDGPCCACPHGSWLHASCLGLNAAQFAAIDPASQWLCNACTVFFFVQVVVFQLAN